MKTAEESFERDSTFMEKMCLKKSTFGNNQKWKKEVVAEFLEPFGGTVTPEMLIEVYDDHFDRLW